MLRIRVTPVLFLLFAFAFGGCEKLFSPRDGDASLTAVFEHLWKDLNERYSYFEVKNVDWESIGEEFRSQVDDEMDPDVFFDLMGDMLARLEDGHVNLLSSFNRSRNWNWYEAYPMNYDEHLIEQHYLKTDFRIIGRLLVQSLDDVLYVRCRSFADEITDAHVDEIVRLLEQHRGVVIDIRGNGGGNLRNAERLAGAFVDARQHYGYNRYKNGRGRTDFTPWTELAFSPREGARYDGKVAVLINRRSYSSSTFFAQMMNSLPQARLFGDQTGGGGGTPAYAELPNGWTYRFSAAQASGLDYAHLEFGVQPDVAISLDEVQAAQGIDTIIEAAVEWGGE